MGGVLENEKYGLAAFTAVEALVDAIEKTERLQIRDVRKRIASFAADLRRAEGSEDEKRLNAAASDLMDEFQRSK